MIKGKHRNFLVIVAALLIVGFLVGAYAFRFSSRARDARYTTSCANHFIQLRMTLLFAANEYPDLHLPTTNDTRMALLAISRNLPGEGFQEQWMSSLGSACPESFRRDGSIGYVYVGDGLRLGDVADKNILILFCPAENHRGTTEHSHAWKNREGGICVKSNAEMITELEHALAEGQSGNVRYSSRAMDVLRREIGRRREK